HALPIGPAPGGVLEPSPPRHRPRARPVARGLRGPGRNLLQLQPRQARRGPGGHALAADRGGAERGHVPAHRARRSDRAAAPETVRRRPPAPAAATSWHAGPAAGTTVLTARDDRVDDLSTKEPRWPPLPPSGPRSPPPSPPAPARRPIRHELS